MPPLTRCKGRWKTRPAMDKGHRGLCWPLTPIQHLQIRKICPGRSWHVEVFLTSVSVISGKEVSWDRG